MFLVTGTVGLAERVAASDESHCLFVIHCHTGEDLADVPRRGDWVRVTGNQIHLGGGKWILEIPTQPLSSEPQ
jgi:hypothetical protein